MANSDRKRKTIIEFVTLRLSGVFTWQPQFCQVKNTWQAQ